MTHQKVDDGGDFHPFDHKTREPLPHWPSVTETSQGFIVECVATACDWKQDSSRKEWAEGMGYRHAMLRNPKKNTKENK